MQGFRGSLVHTEPPESSAALHDRHHVMITALSRHALSFERAAPSTTPQVTAATPYDISALAIG